MAVITEQAETGVGSFVGNNDGEANRLFLVQQSYETDDFVGPVMTAYPRGSAHNKESYKEYRAFSWHEVSYVNPTARLVLVTYRPRNDPAFEDWVTEVEFTSEMADIVWDVPSTVDGTPRRFASQAYRAKPAKPGVVEQITGFAATAANGHLIALEQLGAYKSAPQPAYRSTMTFTMSKRVSVMTWPMMRAVGRMKATCNSVTFLTFKARTILFVNFGVRENFGPVNSGGLGYTYDVRLQFAYDPKGWIPTELFHTYVDPENPDFTSAVKWFGGGSPPFADFIDPVGFEVGIRRNKYGEADLYSIFDILRASAAPKLGGG